MTTKNERLREALRAVIATLDDRLEESEDIDSMCNRALTIAETALAENARA